MNVNSDRWILRMCREQEMIAPFEEWLGREVEGRRIIFAGLSGYGYDLRLASDGFREFSNSADLPIRIHANEGIAQVTFFKSDEVCEVFYAGRAGKYQDQAARCAPRHSAQSPLEFSKAYSGLQMSATVNYG